ncbi:MAG TPA: hypothetical protein VM093_09095 [Aeromicrobium sp.]|nr:hypothetical protein [Aeromicrobium sp.]
MTSVLVAGISLTAIVAALFMVIWIVDARRADNVAADPERVQDAAPGWRRRLRARRR